MQALSKQIKNWGLEFGFQQVAITDTNLSHYEPRFLQWLEKKFHGQMTYMAKHGTKRTHPEEIHPGTLRIISVRQDYLPPSANSIQVLENPRKGFISRYALGKDYHKLMRKKLKQFALKIRTADPSLDYRVFCDSAPVLEKAIAEKAGLGWIGKHTNLINAKAGSWFFLGEIFTNLPLIIDAPQSKSHCGSCTACIDVCPTRAIVAPYQLDARLCISYLTIENREAIPIELRPLIGNRIYGCDDCQLFCPWNKFAQFTQEKDFYPRHDLAAPELIDLFQWTKEMFLQKTEGSAIRRIGYDSWLRNIAVSLGNAPKDPLIIKVLKARLSDVSDLVKEHIEWALQRQQALM